MGGAKGDVNGTKAEALLANASSSETVTPNLAILRERELFDFKGKLKDINRKKMQIFITMKIKSWSLHSRTSTKSRRENYSTEMKKHGTDCSILAHLDGATSTYGKDSRLRRRNFNLQRSLLPLTFLLFLAARTSHHADRAKQNMRIASANTTCSRPYKTTH